MKNKFSRRKLYTAKTKGVQIENTEFAGSQKFFSVLSKKNTEKSSIEGEVVNNLSYKIGRAVSTTHKSQGNVFLAEYNGIECVVGVFNGGSKNDLEIFALDTNREGTVAYATNVDSHYLPQLVLALDRYVNPKDEIDLYYRQIDYSDGFIGVNQKVPFLVTCDSLRCDMDKLNGMDFEDEIDLPKLASEFKFTKNLTLFLDESRGEDFIPELKDANGVWNNVDKLPVEQPVEIEMEEAPIKTKETRMEILKKKYWNGISTFEPKELAAMPLLLKNGYDIALQSFFANREFFGLQEWELVDAIAQGDVHAINFTGPAGVGKTTTIRSIAGALGMPFVLVGGSANIEESDLLGCRGVEAVDGTSVTTWTDGPITTAIRYGAFLLFDEVNSAEPGILMKLNTILDGSKSLILSTSEEVKVHPNFVFSEAMNVGAGYAGTDLLNQSHLDRMDEIFKISSKSVEEETKIIASVTGYDNLLNIQKCCQVKRYICDLIDEDGDASEQSCSPRRIIAWVKKAKRTGEFVESSLSTVISHISVYDDSFKTLDADDVETSSGIAAKAFEYIKDRFDNISY